MAFLLATSTVVVGFAEPARADGSPDLEVTVSGPARLLFGATGSHSMQVCNPSGPAGFNTSFRAVLPPNTSYAGGDATAVLPDAPTDGSTTLLFENISDIPQNACVSVAFSVSHETALTTFDVGDDYDIVGSAYANTNPFFIPDFDDLGNPIPGASSYTGFDENVVSTTEIIPIEVTKTEPNEELELLRGLHDHQTVYTLRVDNNLVNPTNGIVIDDYLDAGLEFLSCGGDNTLSAATNPGSTFEYSGSGPIAGSLSIPPCVLPEVVETVSIDPDGAGPLPTDTYTHVQWNNGGLGFDLAASGSVEIQYRAAIPIRENTLMWTGPVPATTGPQASNLDNNSGDETREADASEQALSNYVEAAGTYLRNDLGTVPATDDDLTVVSSEDLSVHKDVSSGTIGQGNIDTWTLTIETSEYRSVDDIIVTDVLPDGLCPLSAIDHDSSDAGECDPVLGVRPTISVDGGPARDIAYTTVVEDTTSADSSVNGSWTITFDPTVDLTLVELANMTESAVVVITIPTLVREFYQQAGADNPSSPVLANDSWENTVSIEGTSLVPSTPTDQTTAIQIQDVSSEGQAAPLPVIQKLVADPALFAPALLPAACPDPGASPTGIPLPEPWGGVYVTSTPNEYGPGDVACWLLRVDFPDDVDTGGATVKDFTPPGHSYIAGSWQATANNSIPGAFSLNAGPPLELTWVLGSAGNVDVGQVFEIVFATEVLDPMAGVSFDLSENLMKFQSANTAGSVAPLRDLADAQWGEAELSTTKTVLTVNGAPPATNPPIVEGADVVRYQVTLINSGSRDALAAEVWDLLPEEISCLADVTLITDGGACDIDGAPPTPGPNENRIEWTGLVVPAGGSETLEYTVTVPVGIGPNESLDNVAGARTYESDTNTGGRFQYVPASNIDPSLVSNTGSASASSQLVTGTLSAVKGRVTELDELGNNLSDEATIGESVDYTVTVAIPPLVTINLPQFVDALGSLQDLRPATVGATLEGIDATTVGWTISTGSNTVTVDGPATYTSDADGADLIVTFSAYLADAPANVKGTTVDNDASFSWDDNLGNSESVASNLISTTVVEPNLQLAKTEATSTTSVSGGDVLSFVLTATNPATPGSVGPAKGVVIVDQLPDFVTPSAISDGGVYDAGLATITWNVGTMLPDATVVRTYTLTIDPTVPAGAQLSNTGTVTGSSLTGSPLRERDETAGIPGYEASDTYDLAVVDASIGKSVAAPSATVGERVDYTIEVTIPADTVLWDARVTDLLPDGMIFDGTGSISCAPACGFTAVELTPTGNIDGSTALGWWLGDIATSAVERTLTIPYGAHVGNTYVSAALVEEPDVLSNTANFGWDQTDSGEVDPTLVADLLSVEETAGPAVANVALIEPDLGIDKQVDGVDTRDAQPGDTFTYSIDITNNGSAPAYDITITDVPDAELTTVTPVLGAIDVIDGWSGPDPDIVWLLSGPIAPSETVTLTYTAELIGSLGLSAADTVDNTAAFTSYFGRPAAERTANPTITYRTYSGPADNVSVDLFLPTASLTKTAVGPDPARVGTPYEWSIVITNTDTVASIGTIDLTDTLPPNWDFDLGSATYSAGPITDPAVTPAGSGDVLTWAGLAGLAPGGSATVTFTASPTSAAQDDPGLGVDHTNTAQAAFTDLSGAAVSGDGAYESNTGSDVAQLAVGSLGDQLWFDADANGAFDGVDIPLAGVTVDLEWAGPDGDLLTTGDNASYSTMTAADGTYSFSTLPEGTFRTTVDQTTLPPGMTPTYDLDDGPASPDGEWIGPLGSGEDKTDVDFGFTGTGSLGELVWIDTDQDGVADGANEPGIPSVTIDIVWAGPSGDLLNAADNVPYTVVTGADGIYTVPNLPAGTYQVDVASGLPTGLTETFDLDGGTLTPDGSWTGVLGDGEDKTDVDFGYAGVGSIGDRVWFDADNDGAQDVGELGLSGVVVDLEWGGPDGDLLTTGDNVTLATTTAADGSYSFPDLPDGPFEVSIDTGTLPPGLTESFDLDGGLGSTTALDLNTTTGRDRDDVDFGYTGGGSLGDLVWFDTDEDGIPDGVNEPGIAGVTVNLEWGGQDGDLATPGDNVTYSTVTDGSGVYGFPNLPAGEFRVDVDGGTLPAGLTETYDLDGGLLTPDGSWTGTLAIDETKADVDFGYTGDGALGDTVWFDQNGNGVQEGNEVGLDGVDIDITWAGPDGSLATVGDNVTVSTTTTDGAYFVNGLPSGQYDVSVDASTLPSGLNPTYDLDGGTGLPDGQWIGTLADGATQLNVDFGYNGSGSLGDTVWFDRNADGVVDADESPLEGVGVDVTWFGPDATLGTSDDTTVRAITDSAGFWSVTGLPPGDYQVLVDPLTVPVGLTPTYDLDGGTVTPDGAWLGPLGDGETKLDVDFGYGGSGSIGDYVWIDADLDGVQDPAEGPVVGATVQLTWPGEDGLLGTGDEVVFLTTTDAAGLYLFDGLPAGDYEVEVLGSLPASAPNTFDEDLNGDSTVVVGLADGTVHLTADFGYGGSASIGDRLWWDVDANGIQDPGEPGFNGIEVTLVGDTGGSTFTLTATSFGDGDYLFDGLPVADYAVTVTGLLPAGLSQTFDDTPPLDNSSEVLALPVGTAYLLADFGYTGAGAIGDRVWLDQDGDGVQDPSEPGLIGVDVQLLYAGPDGIFGTGDDITLVQTTGTDGAYNFTNLPDGNFQVVLDTATFPYPSTITTDGEGPPDGVANVTVAGGAVIDAIDFGLVGPGSLGDTVWFDMNGDGVQDASEPGLEGITVTLTLPGADGVIGGGDDVTISTTTGPNGDYVFDGLYDGEYFVTVDGATLPAGMGPVYDLDGGTTTPDGSWQGVVNTAAPVTDVDFGYNASGSIGDRVWLDLNGDGVQDSGEPGLPGVPVELIWPGEDGVAGTADDTPIAAVTGPDGSYTFPGLPAGDYPVTVTPPADLAATYDEDLTPDDTTTVSLSTGEAHATADFGYQGSASIGDTVWYDHNADGIQDPSETPLGGVDVTITWLGADGVVGGGDDVVLPVQTTDSAGNYSLGGLPAGNYRVEPTAGVPPGMVSTFDEDGTPDGVASVTVATGETHDVTDFGYAGTASIGSSIWLDLDLDGLLDVGEPGIPAVDVTLVWAGPDGILGTADDVIFTTTTGADGSFSFPNLPAGPFSVTLDEADLPAGVASTFDLDGGADGTATLVLADGEAFAAPAFGYAGLGSVGDLVWYDVDSDGVADPAEPGVSGATVTVTHYGLDGVLGTTDDILITTATDAAGAYSVTGLPDGSFDAVLDTLSLPVGTEPGSDHDGGDPALTSGTLVGGPALIDVDFGVIGTGTVGGGLFDDINGDGVADPGEGGGPAGVAINVTWQGPDGPVTISVTTGPDGSFSMPNLPPGDYTVAVDESTLPPGVVLTTPASAVLTLAPGGALDVQFGTVELIEIMGVLFVDADGDGTPDSGEDRLAGVTIELYDDAGNLVGSVVSDADGSYSFDGLLPGTYQLIALADTLPADVGPLPDGVVCTLTEAGDVTCTLTVDGTSPVAILDLAFILDPELPFTGIDAWLLLVAALMALMAGGWLMALSRKDRETG